MFLEYEAKKKISHLLSFFVCITIAINLYNFLCNYLHLLLGILRFISISKYFFSFGHNVFVLTCKNSMPVVYHSSAETQTPHHNSVYKTPAKFYQYNLIMSFLYLISKIDQKLTLLHKIF